ncbi:MAG: hypothetical protein ABIG71_02270 [Candidatus Uhrbacteria bacterium]
MTPSPVGGAIANSASDVPQANKGPSNASSFAEITREVLSWSWKTTFTSLPTIIGPILTLTYINLHFIARYVGHIQFFSDFGTGFGFLKGSKGKAGGVDVGKKTELVEIIVLIFIDLIVFSISYIIFCLITYIAENPTEALWVASKSAAGL